MSNSRISLGLNCVANTLCCWWWLASFLGPLSSTTPDILENNTSERNLGDFSIVLLLWEFRRAQISPANTNKRHKRCGALHLWYGQLPKSIVKKKVTQKSVWDGGRNFSRRRARPFPITQASNIKSPDVSFGWLCLWTPDNSVMNTPHICIVQDGKKKKWSSIVSNLSQKKVFHTCQGK